MTDVAVKRDLYTWKQTNTHENRPVQNVHTWKHTPNEHNTISKTPVMTNVAVKWDLQLWKQTNTQEKKTVQNMYKYENIPRMKTTRYQRPRWWRYWPTPQKTEKALVVSLQHSYLAPLPRFCTEYCNVSLIESFTECREFYRVQLVVRSFLSICCSLHLSRVAGKKSQKSCVWSFYMKIWAWADFWEFLPALVLVPLPRRCSEFCKVSLIVIRSELILENFGICVMQLSRVAGKNSQKSCLCHFT